MTLFVVGTRNLNGEEYALCENEEAARKQIIDLVYDGFSPDEIVVIRGEQCPVDITIARTVERLFILEPETEKET